MWTTLVRGILTWSSVLVFWRLYEKPLSQWLCLAASAEAIPEYRNVALCRRQKTGRSWIALSVSTICVWDEGRIFLLGLPRASGRCGGQPGGRAWCQSLPVLSVSTGGTDRVGRIVGGDSRTFCI